MMPLQGRPHLCGASLWRPVALQPQGWRLGSPTLPGGPGGGSNPPVRATRGHLPLAPLTLWPALTSQESRHG